MFGFVPKHRSFPNGESGGDRGRITMEEQRVAPEYLNWLEFQKRGLPLNDH